MNEKTENIGARRLQTIMERMLENISFWAPDVATKEEKIVSIDDNYVNEHLSSLVSLIRIYQNIFCNENA